MKKCPTCNRLFDDKANVCPFDNSTLAVSNQDALLGSVLDKRYRIIDRIGEGGMGKVYKAQHIILDKPFAIKVLNPELAQREDSIKRFINEARLTSKIGHPNIIEVTDFGKTPGGSFYFVMEYVSGKTLFDLLNSKKTIPIKETIEIITQCADALYAAHQAGIIHRDLKPDNIMLVVKGDGSYFAKILDFGISKIIGEASTRLTSSGVIIGTPEYMSPEQASQENTDHRTDIYSLGVIMYQMLTGSLPFYSTNPLNLLMMHKTKSPKPMKSFNPNIPTALENICMKCLSKNPQDRYQDMRELMNALNDLAKGKADYPVKPSSLGLSSGLDMDTQDIHNIDVPPEKIEEVRNKLFADSNSVWFDPYSKPEEKVIQEEKIEQPKSPESIIIDSSAVEEKIDLAIDKKPKSEEIQLATEVPKPRSPAPKVQQAAKAPHTSIKTPYPANKSNFESLLNKKNLLIGVSSLIFVAFLLGIIIYKTTTSGIDAALKKEIQFNTPLPVNPTNIQPAGDKQENKPEDKAENTDKDSSRDRESRVNKSQKPKAEKTQTSKEDATKLGATDYFKEANNYFKQGKYDMAAEYYKSAIRLKPDFAMAYRGLGACYAMLGKSELSIKQYEKYIELDPNGPDVEKVIKIINDYRNKKK